MLSIILLLVFLHFRDTVDQHFGINSTWYGPVFMAQCRAALDKSRTFLSGLFIWAPFKRSPYLFHPAAILPQVPISEAGRRTGMDKTFGGVQYEQAVIDETEEGSELDPDGRSIV
jgi:hypothetical protein